MTLRDTMVRFKPPFPVSVMEWKVQAMNSAKDKALAAPYADTRAYEDRLNEVVPEDWTDRAEFLQAGDRLICTVHLTILGVTRAGDGESPLSDKNAATIAYSQAFKRACSRFGLGRYLYDLDTGWQEVEQRGKSHVFTSAAMNRLRQNYLAYCKAQATLAGNGHEPQEPRVTRQAPTAEEQEPPSPAPTPDPKPAAEGPSPDYPTNRWHAFRDYVVATLDHYAAGKHVLFALRLCYGDDYQPWTQWSADEAARCWDCLTQRLPKDEDETPVKYAADDPKRPFTE